MTTTTLPTPAEVVAAALARAKMPPEKGDIGLKGEPGRDGESVRGEKGDKGESIRGDPGRDGVDGRSMLAGEGKPGSIGKAGDLYLDTTNGAVWRRDTEWREVGNLRGPAAKAAIDGLDGTSIFAGVGQPIAPSNEGDLYLETVTGDLYRFDTGAWHVIGNLRGPKGETGATGRGGLFPRPGGGSSSGSGLPSGGTVGQVVTNTGPGAGDWEDAAGGVPVVGQASFGVDQAFRLDLTGNPAGGSFTLIFDDGVNPPQETAAIAYNAEAFEVADALIALSNVTADGVEAHASGFAQSLAVAPKAVILNWANAMGKADRSTQVSVGQQNFTGGTSPEIEYSPWYLGSEPSAEVPAVEVRYQTDDLGGLQANLGTVGTPDWESIDTIVYRDPLTGLPRAYFKVSQADVNIATFDESGGVWSQIIMHTPLVESDTARIQFDVLDYFEEVSRQFKLDKSGFKLRGVPTADPSLANYIWADHGVLVFSGSTAPTSTPSFLSVAKWS